MFLDFHYASANLTYAIKRTEVYRETSQSFNTDCEVGLNDSKEEVCFAMSNMSDTTSIGN